MQTTAIILAGGKSKRMGTDKALLKVEGISLLEKSILLCNKVCDEIIISSNNAAHYEFGFPVVADEVNDCGPIGGILSCLKQSKTDWNFVISVDAAFVEPEFVNFLFLDTDDYDAIVPIHSKGKEPLIAFYNKSSLAKMEEMLQVGDYKMHNLLASINTKFVNSDEWLAKHPKLLHNLNRPEDL